MKVSAKSAETSSIQKTLNNMRNKGIEIYYNIADIPDIRDRSGFSLQAHKFRNAAMDHIENALEAKNAGEWTGAEIGSGEVNFGFLVDDYELAEAIVREAVSGTKFEGIREIQRREFDDDDEWDDDVYQDMTKTPLWAYPFILIAIPMALVGFCILGIRGLLDKLRS